MSSAREVDWYAEELDPAAAREADAARRAAEAARRAAMTPADWARQARLVRVLDGCLASLAGVGEDAAEEKE